MLRYRILMAFMWLAVPVAFAWRLARGKDTARTFAARFGFGMGSAGERPVIWLHAASVGELNTLSLLIAPMAQTFPGHDLLVTVANRIAFENAQALGGERVHVAIAPLDFPFAVKRFLRHWRPVCAITLENEVYPIRIHELTRRNAPIIHVNARMSAKSHAAWARRPGLAKAVFGSVRLCFAQDTASVDRFADLGVAQERIEMLGNLKQFCPVAPPAPADLAAVRAAFPPERTLCVASTHKGEDEILIETFRLAKAENAALRMILVPRHPARAGEIARLIEKAGFAFATRSKRELPRMGVDVYLADTVGEMALWYSSAAVTFVAGSLVPVGGHTPYEPAGFGSAIIHGPLHSNFEEAYGLLLAAGGSVQAQTAEEIARAWLSLLEPARREAQVQAARAALLEGADRARILGRITDGVQALLAPASNVDKPRSPANRSASPEAERAGDEHSGR